LSPRWFRRRDRGSDISAWFDDQLDGDSEPLRSVTFGDDRGIRDRPGASARYTNWGPDEWTEHEEGSRGSASVPPRPQRGWSITRIMLAVLGAAVLPVVTLLLVNHQPHGADETSVGPPNSVERQPSPARVFPSDDAASAGADVTAAVPPTPSARPAPSSRATSPRPVVVRVALHTLRPSVVADGPSGRPAVAVLGSAVYPDSTAVFVSCTTRPATLSYRLDGAFTDLTARAGLTGSVTPGNLVARFVITGDGRTLASVEVSLDHSVPIPVDLTGVRTLVVSAVEVRGTCRNSDQPYGVLGTAMLTGHR
jgi:hypothetical protein